MTDLVASLTGFSEHEKVSGTESQERVQEATFTTTQIHESARTSLDFLAAIALPTIFRYFYPDMYQAAWQWLLAYVHKERDFSQLALGLPRGFAKTTFIKIFLLYVILFTKKKFILVCAENHPKATNIIADVMDMLNESNIKRTFGDWKQFVELDQAGLKKFTYRGRSITIAGSTVDAVRGLNIKNERPDIMVFDDIQSRKDAESEILSATIEREMIGTAMKAKSPHGCLFIFVGNMYPTKYSLLKKIKANPNWLKFIVGGINAKGESIWEELQPIKQLMVELENDIASGNAHIFVAEVLNDEHAQANNLIDLSLIPDCKVDEGDIPAGNFIFIDPSNDRHNSDAVSIGYFEVHNVTPVLMYHIEGRLSPLETIHAALRLAGEKNCRLIAVEGTAYQASLNYWARLVCEQMGIFGIEFVEVYPGSLSKVTRIINALKAYQKGEINVHPNSRAAVHLQITTFNPMKRDNTDGLLDLLAYAPKILDEFGEFVASMNIMNSQEWDNAKVLEHNSPI